MPRPLAIAVALATAAAVLLLPAAAAAGAPWRWPLRGEVAAPYAFSRLTPYARGARRGVDLAARPGALVRAPCGGRIAFAGRLPRFGGALTIRCAAPSGHCGQAGPARCSGVVATLLRLAPSVRRGALVLPGAVVGRVSRAGRLRLGARFTGRRFGYVDPLGLLGTDRPAPIGAAPRGVPRPPGPLPLPGPSPRPPLEDLPPAARSFPWTAWVGMALLAAGLRVGRLVRRRRRARASAPVAGHVPG